MSRFQGPPWGLLPSQDRLRCSHVVVFVVDPDHDYVFRCGAFGRVRRDFKVIIFSFGIGELTDRLHVFPVAGVDGIFGALDGGEAVFGAEADVNLRTLDGRCQISIRGGVVSTSNRRLAFSTVSASPGECEGASEATTFTV